jgi:hypothetical protein
MRHVVTLFTMIALTVAVVPALAGKGGNANGNGNGNGHVNGNGDGSRQPPTLAATPDVLHSGDYFDVAGCGYDSQYGNVIVGFTGGSWGSALDGNGCFTIPDVPALSGDTLSPGMYPVSAYQYLNGSLTENGRTTVTVVD